MHTPTFNQIAQKILAFSNFNVHVYYENGSPRSMSIADMLACALARVIPGAMGPVQGGVAGLCCSFDVLIPVECLGKVLLFLETNHNGLSICIQPNTGNKRNNMGQSIWIGKPLPQNSKALPPPSQQKKAVNNPAPRQI